MVTGNESINVKKRNGRGTENHLILKRYMKWLSMLVKI